MMAEPLILINAFEVPGEEADQFVAAWEKTRDYLATQPGYVDTALHQAVTPGADFQFVNIGRWQSAEDFQAATQSPGFRESAAWPGRLPAPPRPPPRRAQLTGPGYQTWQLKQAPDRLRHTGARRPAAGRRRSRRQRLLGPLHRAFTPDTRRGHTPHYI